MERYKAMLTEALRILYAARKDAYEDFCDFAVFQENIANCVPQAVSRADIANEYRFHDKNQNSDLKIEHYLRNG